MIRGVPEVMDWVEAKQCASLLALNGSQFLNPYACIRRDGGESESEVRDSRDLSAF